VRAKTGSTMVSRALSGYVTTAGGRQAVFSIVINAPNAAAEPAIDAFVTAVAQLGV
jgi:D-alanyl-D-alanine carboxypeptidase